MTVQSSRPTDEDLSAFLDGEADADIQARIVEALSTDRTIAERLEKLDAAGRALAGAADHLLDEAPEARMRAQLAGLLASKPDDNVVAMPAKPRSKRQEWRPSWLAAAALVLLIAGVAADRTYLSLGHEGPGIETAEDESEHWREAVANYFALYTDDTFAGRTVDPDAARPALERVGAKLGLDLTPAGIALPDAKFAGAILFGYDGLPLVQIAYVDPQAGPMALCIIAQEKAGDAAPQAEIRDGMNIVHWAKDGHAYMLIGHAAPDRIAGFADALRAQLG